MRADRVRLGVDFGTSSTVAVVGQPDGQVRPLLFGETPILPSAVCLDWRAPDAGFLVGRDAIHAGRAHPDAFEPNPKLRIDDGSVLLGATELPVTTLIGAVLRRVGTEAERVAGAPVGEVTLTYPASWGPRRRSVLQEAAREAGLPEPAMVAEPVAAAAYFVDALGHAVPVGQCVVVYDFGAGTFDASVVGRTADGYTVLAEEGLRDAGGLDIDNAVVAYFGATYGVSNGELWRRLTHPETPADRRTSRHFWEDVRTGKEMLSRSSSTSIFLPLVEADALLGREQLEHLARPLLDRTIAATAAAIRAAQVDATRIAGVFLVGGSSRIPLAATLLHRVLGIAPTIIEQPELIVAGGSLIAAATAPARPAATGRASVAVAPSTVPVPAAPVSPPPPAAQVSPPAAQVSPPAAQVSPAAGGSPAAPPAPGGSAGPGYTLPSSDLPSTFEQPVPPSPWEQTPAGAFAAGPVSAAPVSPGVSAMPVSPSAGQFTAPFPSPVSAAPVSPPVSAAPVSPPMSTAPVSPPMGAAQMSPPVSGAPVSPIASGAPVSPPVSGAPVSPSAGQFPTGPVSGPPGAAHAAWPPPPAEPDTTWRSAAPPVATPENAWPPPVATPENAWTQPVATPDNAWPQPAAGSDGAWPPPAAGSDNAWPPAAPLAGAPSAAPHVPVPAGVVRGVGIAVAATALLRFVLMFQDNGSSAVVLNRGIEPVFDYLALAVLIAAGGWLAVRPQRARPALAALAGFTPWAILPIVGNIGLVTRYYDWTDEYPLMTPMLALQVLALLAAAGLVCQAVLRGPTAGRLVPLGLAAVALWTSLAAMLWLTSGYDDALGSGQVARVGLGLAVATVVIYAAAGSREWAGWTVGAWIAGALLWMIGAGTGEQAEGRQVLPATLIVLLLVAAAVLLVVRLRAGRAAAAPPAGLPKGAAAVALVAAGIAAAGLACALFVLLEQWSYEVDPRYVAEMFGSSAGLAVLLGGLLLLAARRSAGAAAYCVGASAGPVSLLASPERLDDMTWPVVLGLVLFAVAALILVVVLIRSAPTRISWPPVAVAAGCVLLLVWATTAEPYLRLDPSDRWLLLAVFAAIPAAVLWKGGLVTAGVLFGVAAGSVDAQFITAYTRADEGTGLLLGVAVLGTLATGVFLVRSAPEEDAAAGLAERP